MNNCSQSVQKKDDIINIIDDFNYDAQTEEYNIEYKKWRSNKDNPYAFNYVENKKEKHLWTARALFMRTLNQSKRLHFQK